MSSVINYMRNADKRFIMMMLICAVILAPILAFPIGFDDTIFIKMAKILLNGGRIYKDAIDIKPPMVYYLFALLIKVFGSTDFSLRLAEYFLNMISCGMLFLIMNKLTFDSLSKYLAPVIYSLVYASLDSGSNFQGETIVVPAFLLIIYLSIFGKRNIINLVMIGLAFGLVVALKYTFIVYLAIWIACYYKAHKPKFKDIAIVSAVFGAVSILIFLSAFIGNSVPFTDMNRYMAQYTSLPHPTPYLFYTINLQFTTFFYSNVSFLVLLGALTALWNRKNTNADEGMNRLILYSSAFILAGIISIFIEMKFFLYHFSRMLVFISILSSIGLSSLLISFRQKKKTIIVTLPVVIFLMLLSPIPQAILNYKAPLYLMTGHKDRYDNLFSNGNPLKLPTEAEQTALIEKIKQDQSRAFFKTSIICSSGSILNRILGNETYSRFSNSQFIIGIGMPGQWKKWFVEELNTSDWVIINKSNRWPNMYGNDLTPYECIKAFPEYISVLQQRFDNVYDTDHYKVFRRK